MFGLNDNEDKSQGDAAATGNNDLAAAIDSGLASAALPPNDAGAPLANPIVSPGSDPVAATVPVESAIPAPAHLEAVPSVAVPQESAAPLTAEATMPEVNPLDSVNMENAFMDESPKKKKGGKKHDTPSPSAASMLTGTPGSEELLDIKQRALQSLTPLIDQLDQTPEEKFKTIMMLIQASDNSELVKEAYAAANDITDEKSRAQALLDVVNEINYFTQHQQDHSEQED